MTFELTSTLLLNPNPPSLFFVNGGNGGGNNGL